MPTGSQLARRMSLHAQAQGCLPPWQRAPAGTLRCAAQIVMLNLVVNAGVTLNSSVTAAYQIVRVLRLLRFFSLLRRLYSTALATSAFVLPGVSVRPYVTPSTPGCHAAPPAPPGPSTHSTAGASAASRPAGGLPRSSAHAAAARPA